MSKYDWDLEKIKSAVKESVNLTEVLEKMNIPRQGNNSKTLRSILDKNNIDYSHFTGRARKYSTNYTKAEEYLSSNKKISSAKLKVKLVKENLIEDKCAICGISSWMNKPITLQLHHINGNHYDNRLENLQVLCPNCHSQTDNYCGNVNANPTKYYCEDCGKQISSKKSKYCPVCAAKHKRKLERPSLEELIETFKNIKSYKGVGEIYGVSDSSIKKWFISYGLPDNIKDLKNYILNT